MACSVCELAFRGNQTVVAYFLSSGTVASLWVQNQGRNIVMIRRINLCYSRRGLTGILSLRPPPEPISWSYPSAFLERGLSAQFYQITTSPGTTYQVQVEYIEIDGRSQSCPAQFLPL